MKHLIIILTLVFPIFHAAAQEPDIDEEEDVSIQIYAGAHMPAF